jgi:hypothetical protein
MYLTRISPSLRDWRENAVELGAPEESTGKISRESSLERRPPHPLTKVRKPIIETSKSISS